MVTIISARKIHFAINKYWVYSTHRQAVSSILTYSIFKPIRRHTLLVSAKLIIDDLTCSVLPPIHPPLHSFKQLSFFLSYSTRSCNSFTLEPLADYYQYYCFSSWIPGSPFSKTNTDGVCRERTNQPSDFREAPVHFVTSQRADLQNPALCFLVASSKIRAVLTSSSSPADTAVKWTWDL